MIAIENLVKYYGDRKAIGPLSFTINPGEIVGLLGLNGAGKTTTMRILACDLLPSSGRVLVDGIDIVEEPHKVRAQVGYLPDHPPLYEEMTVHEYLYFAARLRQVPASDLEKKVVLAEESTQLGSVRHQLISTLSHGYKQRVGIAQAIVHKPRLLVLDEPISGLDPVQIVEMRELLRGLREQHTTLISSHILSEISETCDRLLVIREGEIVAAGTEQELSSRFLGGGRVVITARGAEDKLMAAVKAIDGVTLVEKMTTIEPGKGLVTLELEASRDVREDVCRTLVGADIGLLEMARSERELESIFLRLAKPGSSRGGVS